MLVLSRKAGERIMIGENITIVVNRVAGNRVTIGIEAPHDYKIIRAELKRVVEQFSDEPFDSGKPGSLPGSTFYYDEDATLSFTPRVAR